MNFPDRFSSENNRPQFTIQPNATGTLEVVYHNVGLDLVNQEVECSSVDVTEEDDPLSSFLKRNVTAEECDTEGCDEEETFLQALSTYVMEDVEVLTHDPKNSKIKLESTYFSKDKDPLAPDDEEGEKDERIKRRKKSRPKETESTVCGQINRQWPPDKTDALLMLVRKYHLKFKKGLKSRKAIWAEISAELKSLGFRFCDRDECQKKWDNLFRTYKNIRVREGNGDSWELYNPVKDLVKLLNWPDPLAGARKGLSKRSKAGPKAPNLKRLLHAWESTRNEREAHHAAFAAGVQKLNDARDALLKKLTGMLGVDSVKSKAIPPARQKETASAQKKTKHKKTPNGVRRISNVNATKVRQKGDKMDQSQLGGLYVVRVTSDGKSGDPVYELVSVTKDQLEIKSENTGGDANS